MSGTNFILPFAQGAGANALSDQAWAGIDVLAQGFQAGILPSNKLNKVLRQSTSVASGFGQFTAQWSGVDFSDALTPDQVSQNFRLAMAAAMAGVQFAVDSSQLTNQIIVEFTPKQAIVNGSHQLWVKVANTNTGPVTLQENGNVALPMERQDGSAIQAGDLIGGVTYLIIRDGAAYKLVSWARSEIANMIATAIANSGGIPGGGGGTTPGPTGQQIVTQYGIPTNVKRLANNIRTAIQASGALNFITACQVPTYNKIGAANTTNLLVISEIQGYTPQQGGAGATYQQLTDGAGHSDQKALSMSINLANAGAVSITSTQVFLLQGVPAGNINLILGWSRLDNVAWYSVCNPDGADFAGGGAHPGTGVTSTFTIMEIPV